MEGIRSYESDVVEDIEMEEIEETPLLEETRSADRDAERIITQLRMEISDLRKDIEIFEEGGDIDGEKGREDVFGGSSLRYFSVDNPVRQLCIMVVLNPYFEFMMMFLIIFNILIIALKDPREYRLSYAQLTPFGSFIYYCETIFLAAYTMEALVKIIAYNFFVGSKNAYLRSAWNSFDFIVVVSGWLMFVSDLGSISTLLRIVRVFRLLSGIKRAKHMRVLLESVIQSLPALLSLVGVVFLFMMLFGVMGVQIFGGAMTGRCFNTTTDEVVNVDVLCSYRANKMYELIKKSIFFPKIVKGWAKGLGGNKCGTGEMCGYYGNPRGGWVNFDNIGYSILTIFQICTKVAWVEDMYFAQDGFSPYSWVYFVPVVVLGGIVLQNIFTAVLVSSYESVVTIQKRAVLQKRFFNLEEKDSSSSEDNGYESPGKSPELDVGHEIGHRIYESAVDDNIPLKNVIEKAATDELSHRVLKVLARLYLEIPHAKTPHLATPVESKNRLFRIIEAVAYDRILDFMVSVSIVFNTLVLCIQVFDMNSYILVTIIWINRVILFAWIFEVSFKFVAVIPWDFRAFFRVRVNILDLIVLVISILELAIVIMMQLLKIDRQNIFDWEYDFSFDPAAPFIGTGKMVTTLSILRLFRLLFIRRRFYRAEKDELPVQNSTTKLVDAIFEVPKMALLLIIFWVVYALIGMRLYALRMPGVRWNFDDLFTASVTSFQLLTTENWPFVMYDALILSGETFWTLTFFVTAIVISNWILLNLFVAVIVGIFSTRAEKTTMRRVERLKLFVREALAEETSSSALRRAKSTSDILAGVHLEKIAAIPAFTSVSERELPAFPSRDWFRSRKNRPLFVLPKFYARHAVGTWYYDIAMLIPVILSVLLLGIKQHGTNEIIYWILFCGEAAFFVFALSEFVVKCLLLGVAVPNGSYFRCSFNIFDFICLILSLVSLFFQLIFGYVSLVALLRCIRFFRILRMPVFKRLRLILRAVFMSLKESLFFAVFIVFLYIVFAVYAMELFSGQLQGCNDPTITLQENCTGVFFNGSTPYYSNVVVERKWENVHPFNFDNFFDANTALFTVTNFAGWLDVLWATMDIGRTESAGKLSSSASYASTAAAATSSFYDASYMGANPSDMFVFTFFSLFIVATSVLAFNLFVAVLIETVLIAKEDEEGVSRLNRQERMWHRNKVFILRSSAVRVPKIPKNVFLGPFCNIIMGTPLLDRLAFVLLILILTIFSLEHSEMSGAWEVLMDVSAVFFVLMIALEMFLRISAHLLTRTIVNFIAFWNVYQMVIMVLSFVALAAAAMGLIPLFVVRAAVVLSVLRLVKYIESLRTMSSTLYETLGELFQLLLLMFIVFFLYAVVGVVMFGDVAYNEYVTPRANFKNILIALLTLLRIATVDAWVYVQYGLMYDDPFHCNPELGNCGTRFAPIYFASFILIVVFVLFSLIIAIFVEKFSLVQERKEKSNYGAAESIISESMLNLYQSLWSKFDPDATGFIRFPAMKELILRIGKPLGAKDLNHLLSKSRRMALKPVIYKGALRYSYREVLRGLVSCALKVRRLSSPFTPAELASVSVVYARPIFPWLHEKMKLLPWNYFQKGKAERGRIHEEDEKLLMDIFTSDTSREYDHPSFHEEVAANVIQSMFRVRKGYTFYIDNLRPEEVVAEEESLHSE